MSSETPPNVPPNKHAYKPHNQHQRRQNRNTTNQPDTNPHPTANSSNAGPKSNKNQPQPLQSNTFAGYSIVEHSNLLRNAVIQSKNTPYTYYSSYYAVVPNDKGHDDVSITSLPNNDTPLTVRTTNFQTFTTPITFNEYIDQSVDDMFCVAFEANVG